MDEKIKQLEDEMDQIEHRFKYKLTHGSPEWEAAHKLYNEKMIEYEKLVEQRRLIKQQKNKL